jgi:predicted dehydrogenase
VNITPTRFHRDYMAAIARAGKPCFAEKPLAPTFDVVLDIVRLVHDAGIPVQVGFQSRFHPLIRRLRSMIETGESGAPMAYTLRDDQFWPTGGVVAGHSSWRSDRSEAGGGALLEHSIHSCDILNWLFGPVERVYATTRSVFGYSVEDVAALTIEHGNGVVGNLVGVQRRAAPRGAPARSVLRARVVFHDRLRRRSARDWFLVHRADEPHAQRYDVDAAPRPSPPTDDPDREGVRVPILAHRVRERAARDADLPDVNDARAHSLVEAAYRSAAGGRWISASLSPRRQAEARG